METQIKQKEVRNWNATDITNWHDERLQQIKVKNRIAYSMGLYGCNGQVFEGEDGELYKIVGRVSNLFLFM